MPSIVALQIADPPDRWEALGFMVTDGVVNFDGLRVELGRDVVSWTIEGIPDDTQAIDGLPTIPEPTPPRQTGVTHPNGAIGVDHLVITTPDFDRTAAALQSVQMPLRRIRDAGGFRQGFRRLGPAILELVEVPNAPPGPAAFWGLVIIVADLHTLAHRLGEQLGTIKPAVQQGRRIATLRASANLGQKLAFMEPEPA